MKRILSKGKVIIAYISVFAILATSLVSMFTGTTILASAVDAVEGETGDETTGELTYPLSGSYDADYVEVDAPGIEYVDVDLSKKTKTDRFTGFDVNFCIDPNTEGNGTAGNPYIIKTANQFAAVVTGRLKDANGAWMATENLYFKIADDIRGFDLNNTGSDVDFSKDTLTAADVEAALKDLPVPSELKWENVSAKPFMGHFNGNGAAVYGLKGDAGYTAIFPKVGGNLTVKNLTVKNCYFTGNNVAVFYGANMNPGKSSTYNTKLFLYNCQAYNNVVICSFETDEAIQKAGILIGQTEWPTEANLVVNDCLVYGNIAKHATREITYGLVGNLHRSGSLMITSCIVMDSAPHALYYGSNAHNTPQYEYVYTNAIGYEWFNVDVKKNGDTLKYRYNYSSSSNGNLKMEFDMFDKYNASQVNNGKGYGKEFVGNCMFTVTPDDLKGKSIPGLSTEKWTFNENGYPTPKIYNVREYSAGKPWSGEIAVQFGEGEGTAAAPYTIATAEEFALMLMNFTPGAYYKLVADININDTTVANWTENARTWFTSNDIPEFRASLDGNGHTVNGLYYDGTQAGEYAGLIPVIGNTATIRGLTVANSVIKANKGAAGAIAGAVADKCIKVVTFDACVIEDTVKFEGNAKFGGMVGKLGYSVVKITDCISKTNGLFAFTTGEVKLNRSISVGAYPFAEDNTTIKTENVYTDVEGTRDGITVVPADAMVGAGAADAMPGLNFPTSWVVTNDYPKATGAAMSAEGTVGEPWTGAIATKYAGGTGTQDDPYLIETAEQLAYFIWKGETGSKDNIKYVKLAADIYLSDINSPLFKDKIGCTDWFTQRTTKTYNNLKAVDFDGDGYVIHGLFFDSSLATGDYVRVALFPMLGQYSTIHDVGLSNAYLVGRTGPENAANPDTVGGFVGCIEDFDAFLGLDSHDAAGGLEKLQDPANDYENMAVKFKNCFIDHRSYISGFYTGALVGNPYAAIIAEDCILTCAIGGHSDPYYTGLISGADSTYGSQYRNVMAFPASVATPMIGGSGGASWRSAPNYWVTHVTNTYYFATKMSYGAAFNRISNPDDRVGEAAVSAMPGFDWENKWRPVDGGTPMLTIFDKHRSPEEVADENNKRVSHSADYFSMVDFVPPTTTLSFSTGVAGYTLPAIEAPMYSQLADLPVISRDGYEFLGWFVWDDPAVLYEYDYHPPRDLTLYAGWEQKGVIQTFDDYSDSIWDYDSDYWRLNKPGAKGGYKNKYVRNGSKSMHLLGETTEPVDCLLNYEEMLEPGKSYTISFWVNTDKVDNPATLLSLVHNSKPDFLESEVASENMAIVAGLKVDEWVQYSYSFTAKTKWVSLRATGAASLWFDDVVMAELDGNIGGGNYTASVGGTLSPSTGNTVSVTVLISAIMACAIVAVVSRKNLVEVVEN